MGKSYGYAQNRLKKMGVDTSGNLYTMLNENDIDDICQRYNNGETAKSILHDYQNVIKCENSIIKIAKNAGVKIRSAKRYTKVDETYFDVIDTENKAYILGLLLADGFVLEGKGLRANRTPSWGIGLKKEDVYILEFIRQNVGAATKKFLVRKKDGFSQLIISSRHMVETLSQYSIVPQKTYKVCYPFKSKEFPCNAHVIRGFFDGNGSVTKTGRCFFYGNEEILNTIRNILVDEARMSYRRIGYNKANHIWYFSFSSKDDLAKFKNYIYSSATIYMMRKFERL